jgi:hypothetical protein
VTPSNMPACSERRVSAAQLATADVVRLATAAAPPELCIRTHVDGL